MFVSVYHFLYLLSLCQKARVVTGLGPEDGRVRDWFAGAQ